MAEEKKKGLTEINLEHLIRRESHDVYFITGVVSYIEQAFIEESFLYWQGAYISGDRNDDGEKDIFVANYYRMQCEICCSRARDKNLLTVLYSMILIGLI